MNLKKFTLIALPAFISLSLLTTSCKKSNDGGSNSMSATFGTKNVSSSSSLTLGVLGTGFPYMAITGTTVSSTDSIVMVLTVDWPVVLNKKVSSDTDFYANFTYYDKAGANLSMYDAGQTVGSLLYTVTSVDTVNHKIGGSFSGVMYNLYGSDSVVVNNGKFNTAYKVQ